MDGGVGCLRALGDEALRGVVDPRYKPHLFALEMVRYKLVIADGGTT